MLSKGYQGVKPGRIHVGDSSYGIYFWYWLHSTKIAIQGGRASIFFLHGLSSLGDSVFYQWRWNSFPRSRAFLDQSDTFLIAFFSCDAALPDWFLLRTESESRCGTNGGVREAARRLREQGSGKEEAPQESGPGHVRKRKVAFVHKVFQRKGCTGLGWNLWVKASLFLLIPTHSWFITIST